MEVLHRIFSKPLEVTQFWASDRYLAMRTWAGNTVGHLYKYCPEYVRGSQPEQNGDWFLAVCDGEEGPSVGDFLPRILPSRHNIALLDAACIRASGVHGAHIDKGGIKGSWLDDDSLFTGIQGWCGVGEMELANPSYQRDLWRVFADDWGLELPAPERFGIDHVRVIHRPGLPCAAAMVRAVQPIIEAVHGEMKCVYQSAQAEGRQQFDVMEYQCADGRTFVQRYDITDVFGRDDLDWLYFHF